MILLGLVLIHFTAPFMSNNELKKIEKQLLYWTKTLYISSLPRQWNGMQRIFGTMILKKKKNRRYRCFDNLSICWVWQMDPSNCIHTYHVSSCQYAHIQRYQSPPIPNAWRNDILKSSWAVVQNTNLKVIGCTMPGPSYEEGNSREVQVVFPGYQ